MNQNTRIVLWLLGVLASSGMFTSWILHFWIFGAEEFSIAWVMWPFGVSELILGFDGLRRRK